MKISARNVHMGTVLKLLHGAVNSEVVIELPGGIQITSIITKDSATSLSLAVGRPAYAIIKASDVMIGVD